MKKSSNVIGSRILSSRFDYMSASKTFMAEISEISDGGFGFDNSAYECDQRFVMISAKTGDEVEFFLSETQRDAEGEIIGWGFRPTSHAIFYNSNLQNVKVIILND